MINDIVGGLDLLVEPATILAVVLGLLLGFGIGLIPGMSASNTCAILLPLTLTFSTGVSLGAMVGVYAGAIYGMAIPAIITNIPTEPGAAATAMDGYPMARQGRAAEAIGVARLASVTGGLIGIPVALFVLQPLGNFALNFGPAEIFLLVLLAMMTISSVVGRNAIKGLLAASLGLLISTMSANPYTSVPRMTFGFLQLYDSVPLIPIVIGLFAFSEMAHLARLARSGGRLGGENAVSVVGRPGLRAITDGMRTTARYPGAVIRSGVVGLLLGVLPGVGHSIANFVSYDFARRTSKRPELFGTGTPEGVIASEGCDNGVAGGSMIPMLALGIPGSATTAVLLAALTLHGINPGPQVLVHHASEAYMVVLALFLANLLILPLGTICSIPMLAITRVRVGLLVPIILVVCVASTYSYRESLFDLWLAFVFGLVGILMRAGGFPLVPLLIGVVLGPLLESNLLLALNISGFNPSYFFQTWIDKGLVSILALVIGLTIYRSIRPRITLVSEPDRTLASSHRASNAAR